MFLMLSPTSWGRYAKPDFMGKVADLCVPVGSIPSPRKPI